MDDTLFDIKDRIHIDPANHNENTYDYYNNSGRYDISIIRNALNNWFVNYPDNEKIELKNRFKKEFDSAFYELFLYNFFIKLGYHITIHPKLSSSSKKPDFLISKENHEIYIEAKIIKGKSREQAAVERKYNHFYDNLNKLEAKDFLLGIEQLKILTSSQPSPKDLIAYLEQEISKLSYKSIRENFEINGYNSLPQLRYNNGEIDIIVRLIPVIPSARGEKKRPIGIYPSESFWGGGEESLKYSIQKKVNKYGKFDKPFMVCINSLDIRTSGKIDIDNAIWGSLAWSWSKNPSDKDEKCLRQLDGVFFDNGGIKHKNLSGIFVSKIFPHNIPVANYWIYKHPFSENTFDFNSMGLPFNYYDVNEKRFYDNIGDDISKIIDIPTNWLTK